MLLIIMLTLAVIQQMVGAVNKTLFVHITIKVYFEESSNFALVIVVFFAFVIFNHFNAGPKNKMPINIFVFFHFVHFS